MKILRFERSVFLILLSVSRDLHSLALWINDIKKGFFHHLVSHAKHLLIHIIIALEDDANKAVCQVTKEMFGQDSDKYWHKQSHQL